MPSYVIQFKPRVEKDLRTIGNEDRKRVLIATEHLHNGLLGDVKRLTNFTPEYRMRIGDYRVLFEVTQSTIVVYRVLHRREAYR